MTGISINRLNSILLSVILFTVIMYFGKPFLVPLIFSILFAMLLNPLCDKLEKWGVNRILSTLAGILIILVFISAIVGIIVGQGKSMADDLPQMQQRIQEMISSLQQWVQENFGISSKEQSEYVKKRSEGMSQDGGNILGSIAAGLMGLLTSLILMLLYFFFIMWKREKFTEFILKLVDAENRKKVSSELSKIRKVSAQYLTGRLFSMVFLAMIYMTGFSVIGLPNGPLIALVAVLPTIVPYVGAYIGGFFPVAMALVGPSPELVWPVVLILAGAQTIDNNLIEPLVEGESLDISPIFTIIAIVLGELVWGIAGMILFIPLLAILKIICDHIPSLHPYSFLLTNDVDEPKWVKTIKQWFGKK